MLNCLSQQTRHLLIASLLSLYPAGQLVHYFNHGEIEPNEDPVVADHERASLSPQVHRIDADRIERGLKAKEARKELEAAEARKKALDDRPSSTDVDQSGSSDEDHSGSNDGGWDQDLPVPMWAREM